MRVRLQKLLAEAGLGSRRGCEDLITAGRVTVNGETATLGDSAEAGVDEIAVDGNAVASQAKEYWLLNKPLDVLSAVVDGRGRETVVDCVPTTTRVYPVGRLDLDSTGLLLLTNDGELAERLLHPRYHVQKEYLVTVRDEVQPSALQALRKGVLLEEGMTAMAAVSVVERPSPGNRFSTTLAVVIHEGKKRQVRRMLDAVGYHVVTLHRSKFATLTDKGLSLGQARRLSAQEIAALRRLAGLA
jgi:23S rRNA pseudouridine2605 synthase